MVCYLQGDLEKPEHSIQEAGAKKGGKETDLLFQAPVVYFKKQLNILLTNHPHYWSLKQSRVLNSYKISAQ